jgi:transposase-like protein
MITRPAIFQWRQTESGLILCAVRWYLRYSLSVRDVEEMLEERGLNVDHTTVWRWVQYYGPELEQRLRPHLKPTNRSWRVDETYFRVKGRWCYLYRAIDSNGATIDFLLSAFRDADAAKRQFCKALGDRSHPRPRVINIDPAAIYSSAIPDSKKEGTLRKRCRHRPVQYLSNILEQDHRAIKRRVNAKQGFREFQGGPANDSRLRSGSHDPEGAGSMGGRRQPSSPDSVHRPPFRFGNLRTNDRRLGDKLVGI